MKPLYPSSPTSESSSYLNAVPLSAATGKHPGTGPRWPHCRISLGHLVTQGEQGKHLATWLRLSLDEAPSWESSHRLPAPSCPELAGRHSPWPSEKTGDPDGCWTGMAKGQRGSLCQDPAISWANQYTLWCRPPESTSQCSAEIPL